jgi:predicted dithiol-disulfide oxidoreductase (DUF899 family)
VTRAWIWSSSSGTPAMFRLFGSKQALFVACLDELESRVRQVFGQAAAADPRDPLPAMRVGFRELLADGVLTGLWLQACAAARRDEMVAARCRSLIFGRNPGGGRISAGACWWSNPVWSRSSVGKPQRRMEAIMNDQAPSPALPPVVDRKTWQEAREALFAREKAHTREGDAIAAARRRLPMVEVDATIEVIGPNGPITILDVFEGRKQLIAYFHAWWPSQPAAEQCEGCTFFNSQVRELSYIHSRDATYATLCKGPYEESVRYRDFLGLDMPWYSVEKTAAQLLEGRDWQRHHLVCYVRDGKRVFETYYTGGRGVEIMAPTHGLLDMTVYGRQETWEDSPDGWPQPWGDAKNPEVWRTNGRPIAQWSRIEAGRSDELT